MKPSLDRHIFISHTTRDERDHDLAKKLAQGLREVGWSVWIAPDSIRPGSEWRDDVEIALTTECTHLLVVLSAASVQSDIVITELELGRRRYEGDPTFTILPLITGDLAENGTDLFS